MVDVETKMKIVHHRMNSHRLIKGSILCKENGMHISSNIPTNLEDGRKLAAYVTQAFRLINKITSNTPNTILRFHQGLNMYVKQIPSRGLILTVLTSDEDSPLLEELMNQYSKQFQMIL